MEQLTLKRESTSTQHLLRSLLPCLEEITDEIHLYENVEGFENRTGIFPAYEEKYLHLTLFASLKSDL